MGVQWERGRRRTVGDWARCRWSTGRGGCEAGGARGEFKLMLCSRPTHTIVRRRVIQTAYRVDGSEDLARCCCELPRARGGAASESADLLWSTDPPRSGSGTSFEAGQRGTRLSLWHQQGAYTNAYSHSVSIRMKRLTLFARGASTPSQARSQLRPSQLRSLLSAVLPTLSQPAWSRHTSSFSTGGPSQSPQQESDKPRPEQDSAREDPSADRLDFDELGQSGSSSNQFRLWPYQLECVEAVLSALRAGFTRIGVSAPTGEFK